MTCATSAISVKLELLYIERVVLLSVFFGMVDSILTFFGSFSGFFGESSISLRLTDARGLTTLVCNVRFSSSGSCSSSILTNENAEFNRRFGVIGMKNGDGHGELI